MDQLSFGGVNPDGTTAKALSKGYLRLFSAVLQGAFRFAVFPKRMISFNPMQYVVWRGKKDDYELFSDDNGDVATIPTLTHEMYLKLEDFLKAILSGTKPLVDGYAGRKTVELIEAIYRATESGEPVRFPISGGAV